MIEFKDLEITKLGPTPNETYADNLAPMLVPGEEIITSYRTIRDGVVFTSKRIISINVQGMTGKKVNYTSLPYSKIQTFSVETAGFMDLDSELELWFSGLGKIKLEFVAHANVTEICRMISIHVL
jgi:hypothetical protein